MAERRQRCCSECQSDSEHESKLKIAKIDRKNFKEISLLFKPPEGFGDDPIPISLSDYSDSENEDNIVNVPLCKCSSDISNEDREFFMLPPKYVVGEVVADGNCFFDSFRQGLHTLGRSNITITELRTICAEIANLSPLWLINSLPSGLTLSEFTKRSLLSDSRGNTELHGRILCEHFNVTLYVLEGNAEYGIMRRLVTASDVRYVRTVPFGRPDTIYIINRGRNHFEPLLLVSPEFEKVHRAIKACDVSRLVAALVDHRRVLYYSLAERQLEQCSLRDAMLSYNIRIVDLLYEHWAGAAFAAHSPHFHNLQRLGQAIVKARDSCLPELNRDQQMVVDLHCLIEFNKFEVQLYQQLNDYPELKPKDRKQQLLRMIDILTTTIDLYELYSDKNIRATKNEVVDILCLQPLFNDKSTIYMKYTNYAMYEMYYQKLDFCVSKVILEYVHSLKEKLKLPEDAYQNIECAIYYFLYRVNEEWRLYMPENRPKGRKHAFLFDTDWDFSHIRDDDYRLFSGPVIYFEWLKFRKSLLKFKEVLERTSIADNFREKGSKLPAEEVNSLTLLPYLRDEHSLRKVVEYLEGAERAIQRSPTVTAALVVQRVLQVTGECLKSTEKSLHLSPTTRALLQMYIPVSTLEHLHALRTDFSKVRDGKLIRRVNIEETNPDLFIEVAKDLKWIKNAIIEVLAVYKPMFDKYLLNEGRHLLRERYKEFSFKFGFDSFLGQAMNEIQKYIAYGHEFYTNLEDNIIKSVSETHSLNITRQFARELGHLFHNNEILESEMHQRDIQIMSYVQILLQPVYSELQNVETQINEWISIRKELEQLQIKVVLPEYPGDTLKHIIDEVKSLKCKTQKQLLKRLSLIKNYAPNWCVIKTILKYIVVTMDLFRKNHYEIKRSHFTNMLNSIDNGLPNASGVDAVKTLISFIKQEVEDSWKIKQLPIPNHLLSYKYEAIKKLGEYMSKKKFITNKEMKYLRDKLDESDIGHLIMEKIMRGEEITLRERDIIYTKIGALDDRCKAIVDNLVIGSKRDECALQCLAQRAELLKHVITGEDVLHLVQRYNQDEGFRILTESLLADIYTVHVERSLWNLLDDNMRLLAEFPMRNILDHGNPLLEVIGKMLDSSDFPATLFRFALRVVEDQPALAELARLYERGVKREQAEREWNGPYTPRFQHYFKLLPSEFGHINVSQSKNDNKENNHDKDIKTKDNPQTVNSQIDDKHIYTNTKEVSKKKCSQKKETVKDQQFLIFNSGAIYCVKYSKDKEKKATSFKNKLWKKKAESLASNLKRLAAQVNLETENVDAGILAKDKMKSTVTDRENASNPIIKKEIEIISEKITNLSMAESLTESENNYVIPQKFKHDEDLSNKMNNLNINDDKSEAAHVRFRLSIKSPIRPQEGPRPETNKKTNQTMSNICLTEDDSSIIQTRKREESDIKTLNYFTLTYLEVLSEISEKNLCMTESSRKSEKASVIPHTSDQDK